MLHCNVMDVIALISLQILVIEHQNYKLIPFSWLSIAEDVLAVWIV
uniref:Uncharacterized protein n=1 Tax=Rhizophora mucronata TaxID=61149 RepID=A0A2P2Q8T2_RHIMU